MGKFFLYLLVIGITGFYLYFQYKSILNSVIPERKKVEIKVPSIPPIKVELPENALVLAQPDLWNLKPTKVVLPTTTQNQQLPQNTCVLYTPRKSGKTYILQSSTGQTIKFFGIAVRKNEKYAIFYDPLRETKKVFLVKKGEKINQNLILKDIKDNNIILTNTSNCEEKQMITLKILSVNEEKNENK